VVSSEPDSAAGGHNPLVALVYMTPEATPEELAAVQERLETDPRVAAVEYLDKAQSLEKLQRLFARQPALLRDVTVEQSASVFRCVFVDPKTPLTVIHALAEGLPGIYRSTIEPPQRTPPLPQGAMLTPSKILLNLPKLIRAGNSLRRHYRDQLLIEGNPRESVVLNDDSKAIRDRARELSAEGREDDEAVGELSKMGKLHERDLKIAELASRERGIHFQNGEANRTHRLLQAAVSGGHVRSIDPQEVESIERCEQFERLSSKEAFAALCAIEPDLRTLETEAKEGRLGRRQSIEERWIATREFEELDEPGREELRQQARQSSEAMKAVERRLAPLGGPDARRDDQLLTTQLAYDTAENWINELLEGDHS
jgi:hypothetical protein